MRTALAVILGIVAFIALILIVVAAISTVLRWRRPNPEQPAKNALITGVGFGVVFLTTSCGALLALPSPEQAQRVPTGGQPQPEPTESVQAEPATTPEPVAEEATEETPEPPPEPEELVIPGLAPVDVYGNLEGRGYACGGPELVVGESFWRCEGSDLSAEYVVEIWGPDGSSVRLVEATAISMDGSPVGASLLGFVATVPYKGSNPEEAQLWVEENVGAERASTKIGGVSYELTGSPMGRILTIKAPGMPG